MQQQPQAYTVTAVTRMIKAALEEWFYDIWVEGEISNYIHYSSGHRYFNLKDENAVLKVTLWRSLGAYLKFEPENGQKVMVFGNITVYEKAASINSTAARLSRWESARWSWLSGNFTKSCLARDFLTRNERKK